MVALGYSLAAPWRIEGAQMLSLSVWEVYLSTQLLPQQGLGQLHAVQQVL